MSKAIGRDNIYREITDKIIAELERGIVPWVQPWSSSKQLSMAETNCARRRRKSVPVWLIKKVGYALGLVCTV